MSTVDVDYSRWFPADLRRAPQWEQDSWGSISTRLARRRVEGARSTCVVLHGGGGNASLLAPVLAALELAGIDSVAPDLPGYGRSSLPAKSFSYETWVAYATDLVKREAERHGGPVAVAGFSIGGMLAYHVATNSGGAVDRIAATNLLDPRRPDVRRGVSRKPWMAGVTRFMVPAFDGIRIPIRWLAHMRAVANDPAFAAAAASDPRGGGSKVPLRFLRTWMNYAPAVEPEQCTIPVLLVHPGADRWTPPELSLPFFERLGGKKRYVLLENCGHAPVEEPGLSTMRREFMHFMSEQLPSASDDTDRRDELEALLRDAAPDGSLVEVWFSGTGSFDVTVRRSDGPVVVMQGSSRTGEYGLTPDIRDDPDAGLDDGHPIVIHDYDDAIRALLAAVRKG
jgi:alpha-beta hydrolase superfamily lysophospholipase